MSALDCPHGAEDQEACVECTKVIGCKRCGAPKHTWQVFCGAACSALYEMGDRTPRVKDPK